MLDQAASRPNDGQVGHLLLHMQLETGALGVLISSYCCSTYRAADLFSSLGTFSSSFIGDLVFHPLLYLTGTGRASQETAISGSCQQNLVGICNRVWVLCCLWDGSPGGQSLDGPSFSLSSELCLCNSFHGCFVPPSKKEQSIYSFL